MEQLEYDVLSKLLDHELHCQKECKTCKMLQYQLDSIRGENARKNR